MAAVVNQEEQEYLNLCKKIIETGIWVGYNSFQG